MAFEEFLDWKKNIEMIESFPAFFFCEYVLRFHNFSEKSEEKNKKFHIWTKLSNQLYEK